METPKFINVLLFGLSGATKSSFVNSVLTLLSSEENNIVGAAVAGGNTGHVTKILKPYPLILKGENLKIRLWDTWGLTLKNYTGNELPFILRGELPPDFEMDGDFEGIRNESKNNHLRRIHSVVVFIPVAVLSDPGAQNFRQNLQTHFATITSNAEVNPIVLLTKVDEVNNQVRSAPNAKYPDMEVLRTKAATLFNIRPANVFYNVNYFTEKKRNFEIDRLNYSVRQHL